MLNYDTIILIFEGLSALGTCSAVIFSLVVLFTSKKVKYIMKIDEIFDNEVNGINIILTNNSRNNLIKITTAPKIKLKNNYIILKPNMQENDKYKIPKTLSYGDSLNFFLDQQQIKSILKNSNKKFIFFLTDALGNTYKIKIKRELFEKKYYKTKNKQTNKER